MLVRILLTLAGLFLLAGCSQRPSAGDDPKSTPTPTPALEVTPTTAVLPTPTFLDVPTVPTVGTPSTGELWQPPEPSKHYAPPPATETVDSPDAMLVYEVASLVGDTQLKVTPDGMVVLGGYHGTFFTYKLLPGEFESLKKQIAAADFFNLADRYWKEDPPDVIAEIPIVTITYKESGRTKAVSLRTTQNAPPALATLAGTLGDLEEQVRTQGTENSNPDLLVDFYLEGADYNIWRLDIDVEGNLYYGHGPAEARLRPEDFEALRGALQAGTRGMSSDEWFTAPREVRDIMTEHRAIVTYYEHGEQAKWINALTGASVPADFEALLEKLAETYDKYAPGN
jgi:hypothetical protein